MLPDSPCDEAHRHVAKVVLVESGAQAAGLALLPSGPGKRGGSTPAEGLAESVPEAGEGTGTEAVGTPTAPRPVTTLTHLRDRRPRRAVTGVGRRTSGETRRLDVRSGGSGRTP